MNSEARFPSSRINAMMMELAWQDGKDNATHTHRCQDHTSPLRLIGWGCAGSTPYILSMTRCNATVEEGKS
jgi:hypothetical protein